MERPVSIAISRGERLARPVAGLRLICFIALSLSTAVVYGEPSYSKSSRFRIPFEFNAQEIARLQVREVLLFTSSDRGRSWQPVGSAAPQQGYIPFEANGDGEYWFSVKTRSESGAVLPPGGYQVALEVLVDSTLPTLQLGLDQAEPGRVRLIWSAQDTTLDESSLALEFRDASTSQWTPVGVNPAVSGQTTWGIARGGEVQVRGRVRDRAGNEQFAEATASITPLPNQQQQPDFSRPVAIEPRPSIPAVMANTPATIPYRPISRTTPEITGEPSLPVLPGPQGQEHSPIITTPVDNQQLALPNVGNVIRQRVNSNQFRIDYSLKAVGSSGVRTVNLYITENGGRKWWHKGVDGDRQSPVEVSVPGDGEYGFAFRVESGAGLMVPPPRDGDAPELVIVVDQTPPVVQLYQIEQSRSAMNGQVTIRWSVPDTDLTERPIALYYATSHIGPWTLIEGSYPNSGSYGWQIPDVGTAEQLFVRVEARDVAGNIGAQESDRPLILDSSHPAIEVLGVQPVGGPRR